MKLPNHSPWLALSMTLAVCAPAVPCEIADFQRLADESPHGVALTRAEWVDDVAAADSSYYSGVTRAGSRRQRFGARLLDSKALALKNGLGHE